MFRVDALLIAGALSVARPLPAAWSQTVPVPNPSFEVPGPGGTAPAGWKLDGGSGAWETEGENGQRSISVTGTADDSNAWVSASPPGTSPPAPLPQGEGSRTSPPAPLPQGEGSHGGGGGLVEGGHRYRLRFYSRREGGSGSAITGFAMNNRDYSVGDRWGAYSFIFNVPDSGAGPLRFGQWHATGKILFDNVSLVGVIPYFLHQDDLELGSGEEVSGSRYDARTQLEGDASNDARFLKSHTAGCNTDRWTFSDGSNVIYRQSILPSNVSPGVVLGAAASRRAASERGAHAARLPRQISASVTLRMNYHVAGQCVIEARSGGDWMPVGVMSAEGEKTFALPAALFPANALEVRLSAAGSPGESAGPTFQISSYHYSATLERSIPAVIGATTYAEIERDADPTVSVIDWGSLRPGPGGAAKVSVGPGAYRLHWEAEGPGGAVTAAGARSAPPAAGARIVALPYLVTHPGPQTMRIWVEHPASPDSPSQQQSASLAPPHPLSPSPHLTASHAATELYAISTFFRVAALDAADFGHPARVLADPAGRSVAGVSLWWAEDGYKIGKTRPAPSGPPSPIWLAAARGEERAVQVVVRPDQTMESVSAAISSFRGPGGRQIPAGDWTIRRVATVPVSQPTDSAGAAGDWPDPLPPCSGPFAAAGGQNQALWILVRAPGGATAGDYHGTVTLQSGQRRWRLPMTLHVWDFTIPAVPHLRSHMGVSPAELKQYHNLKTDAQLRQVWELYMQDFAAHRLTPANAMALDPIRVNITGSGDTAQVTLDTAAFDRAAHHYLDEMGFTAFDLRVEGMGGGTFYNRVEGSFGGYKAGTAEYDRLWGSYVQQLEAHLREKGWLDKAYVYWFDEPAERDFPFVREGMERLKRFAQGLTRLLTKEPEPGLIGAVDLWCPILNAYQPDRVQERQAKGEQAWWYICTGPKAPFPGEFIDRPGADLPVWVWDAWKYGVQGLLIWETTYWNSPEAYPHGLQDPWSDPMSWTSGYGTPSGARQPWGNGDGRFLYPPTAAQRAAGTPILTGPVDSQRWELLRDGMEDYEYFWLLRDAVDHASPRVPAPLLARCRALLTVPETVSRSLTEYSPDPAPMMARREELARAIEVLKHAG